MTASEELADLVQLERSNAKACIYQKFFVTLHQQRKGSVVMKQIYTNAKIIRVEVNGAIRVKHIKKTVIYGRWCFFDNKKERTRYIDNLDLDFKTAETILRDKRYFLGDDEEVYLKPHIIVKFDDGNELTEYFNNEEDAKNIGMDIAQANELPLLYENIDKECLTF